MFRKFYPDKYVDSIYSIHFEQLFQDGYRGLLFDIDNTLVEHGKDATPKAIALFQRLKKIGFSCCLISNNKQERVERFNQKIGIFYIYNAHKPSIKSYEKSMKLMNTTKETTLFIGDQLFTDIYGAKRIGIKAYLTKPIDPHEEIQIVLKRYLERIVLYFYEREEKK